MDKKKYSVYLGRFSPLHKGHEAIIDKIIQNYGKENLLIIIGSSTSHNERTPYSFDERAAMINLVYPDISVIGLPDTEPNRVFFREDTANTWLESIKKIEKQMNAKFTFYGGSEDDLEMLSRKFKTEVIVDRNLDSKKISATKVREAFDREDDNAARKMVNKKVYEVAHNWYDRFRKNRLSN